MHHHLYVLETHNSLPCCGCIKYRTTRSSWLYLLCCALCHTYGVAGHIRPISSQSSQFDLHASIFFALMVCVAWLQSNPAAVFAAWAAHNGKSYAAQDLQARLPIFISNVAGQMSRLGLKEGAMEVNGLADISREEFKQTHLGHVSKSLFSELG